MSVIYIKKNDGYKEFDHNFNELSITYRPILFCQLMNYSNCVSATVRPVRELEILSIYAVKEELADTKGVIRIRKSKDRQYNDLQNIHIKLKIE